MTSNKTIRKILHGCLILGVLLSTIGAGGPLGAKSMDRSRASAVAGVQANAPRSLVDFDLISSTDGWVLTGSRLFWTGSDGQDWIDITPGLPSTGSIHAVIFLDLQTGFVLGSNPQADGSLVLQLERTSDQGRHWASTVIQTFAPDDPLVNLENASMDWLDEKIGWVSVKQPSGSNFSSGTVFRTEDGGQTWVRLSLPIGEAIHFVNSQVGWLAGGPAGDQLFKTQDGGNTWEKQPIPAGLASAESSSLYAPIFDSLENGLLPVVTQTGNDFQLGIYDTGDGGQRWGSVSSLPLGSQVGRLPLHLLDAHNLVAAVPGSDRIIRMANGDVQTVLNQDGMSANIIDLKMHSLNFGWAKWHTADCSKQPAADGSTTIACTATTKLIETLDGGITWKALEFPGFANGLLTQSSQTASTSQSQVNGAGAGKTLFLEGQGFDICTIPTISQLQTWWNNSPYSSVNLYIGGVARYCSNTALTADYVNQMRQQGWTFIPTWVGPQAPCTTYNNRFSSNVDTAFVQGKDEAYFASARLAELGLTNPDKSGSVVYYDMEIYVGDTACREAVKSFVNGWVSHMHDLGNLAGVYGSTGCSSSLNDYVSIPNVPDVIWPAIWNKSSYDPTASVLNVGCIPNTAWANHQRIHQYAGDHNEQWGGVTLNSIDSDVLDGVVAVPYFGTPSANFSASPLNGKNPLTVTFTIANTAFMTSCSWNYGDGQSGSSCAAIHPHTYTSAGTYEVSLTAVGPGGSDTLMRTSYIIVGVGWIYLPLVIRR